MQSGQRANRIACCDEVVGHDAEAVFDLTVKEARRLWFGDVEKAEEQEGAALPALAGRTICQHEPEGNDLVPDDAAVVNDTEVSACFVYGQYAAKEANEKENRQFKLVQPRFEQQKGGPGEESSESSRGEWR